MWGNFLEDLRDHNSETSKVIAVCESLSLLFSVESVSSFHKHTTPSHSGIQFTGGTHQRGYSADQRHKKKKAHQIGRNIRRETTSVTPSEEFALKRKHDREELKNNNRTSTTI